MSKELMKTFWKGPLSVLNAIWDSSFIQNWLSENVYTADVTFSHNSYSNNTLFLSTILKTRALSYMPGNFSMGMGGIS